MPFYAVADFRESEPFGSVEEAWFWCCYCESKKGEREKCGISLYAPPCETSDIFIVLKRLICERILSQKHVKVLSKYGLEQTPPHPFFGASLEECILWKEALEALYTPLFNKNIVHEKGR